MGMEILLKIMLVILAFWFMEFMAWFTHKYVMHGFLWVLHKDHHVHTGKRFEWNDLFALMFAIPSFVLIFNGLPETGYGFFIGIGIALYGLAYFLFHDALVHQRINLWGNTDGINYLRAVVAAHEDHHRGKKNFGFLLFFPWKYFKPENQKSYYNRLYGRPKKSSGNSASSKVSGQ